MNRCPKIEYGRLSGEIAWAGVNSGQISSVRPKLMPGGVQSLALVEALGRRRSAHFQTLEAPPCATYLPRPT